MKKNVLLIVLMFAAVAPVRGGIWLPSMFNDHMVLQAEKPLAIWGKATVGETVVVEIVDADDSVVASSAPVVAGSDQKWFVELPAVEAGLTVSLRVTGSQSGERILTDVLTGELWLCSGQSNMRWEVQKANDGAAEVAAADYPEIRLFTTDLTAASAPLGNCSGSWAICSSNTVAAFSATAYYFGRELHQVLGRPVGLIMSAVGGTPVGAWTQLDPILEDSDTAVLWDIYQANISNTTVYGSKLEKGPARLFNGMIYPFAPITVRGVAWYQGEQNQNNENIYFGGPDLYRKLFPMLVRSWRETWDEYDLPFLYVELANYKEAQTEPVEEDPLSWWNIREAQASALALTNVYTVSAIDIGEADNIHYGDKQTAGRRLALAAFGQVYAISNAPTLSPWYVSHSVESNCFRIRLSNAEGLTTDDGLAPAALAVCDTNQVWYWADAAIDGTDLLVWNDSVPEPVAVRHAWANNPDVNVYNAAGLPLRPFRTDLESSETYLEWAARWFSPEQYTDVSVSGQDADANGDGEVNLFKYAQGIGPFENSRIFKGLELDTDGRPFITYSRKVGAGDQGFVVEATDSLLSGWVHDGSQIDEAVLETMVPSDGGPARQRVKVMPSSAHDTWFARVTMASVPEDRSRRSFGPDADPFTYEFAVGDKREAGGISVTTSLSNETSGGNPGPALQIDLDYTADSSTTDWFGQSVIATSWTYDPSVSGALMTVSLTGDFVIDTFGIDVSISLTQNGVTYWSHTNTAGGFRETVNTAWETVTHTGLTAVNFTDLATDSSHPDFSAAGGEITFGFALRRSDGVNRSLQVLADNLQITLELEP